MDLEMERVDSMTKTPDADKVLEEGIPVVVTVMWMVLAVCFTALAVWRVYRLCVGPGPGASLPALVITRTYTRFYGNVGRPGAGAAQEPPPGPPPAYQK